MEMLPIYRSVADEILRANGSDYDLAESEKEQPEAAKWAIELATVATNVAWREFETHAAR